VNKIAVCGESRTQGACTKTGRHTNRAAARGSESRNGWRSSALTGHQLITTGDGELLMVKTQCE
jgi:hypothetical protein